jgi:hypothetical protein
MKTIKKISVVAACAALLFSVSCKKEDAALKPGNNFVVKMTDSPGQYAALDLEIKGVEAYLEGSGWVNLNSQTQTINVLSLTNGAEAEIANSTGVQAGHYTKVKLILGNVHTIKLNVQSGESYATVSASAELLGGNEIIVEIDEQVALEGKAEVLVDFNVANSVIEMADKYVLSPVITLINDVQTGIQGEVQGAVSAAVIVSKNNQPILSAYADANGKFLLRGIEPGTYTLIIKAMEDIQNAAGTVEEQTITLENVTVINGKITQLGTIVIG